MVLADANIATRDPLGATLTNDDVAGDDDFATVFLHAETLAVAVASVLDGTLSFLMSHGGVGREVEKMRGDQAWMAVTCTRVRGWRWPLVL